jgi:hypothetical protein
MLYLKQHGAFDPIINYNPVSGQVIETYTQYLRQGLSVYDEECADL